LTSFRFQPLRWSQLAPLLDRFHVTMAGVLAFQTQW
jgi:hypothetical protein